jgi:hypothetical protein
MPRGLSAFKLIERRRLVPANPRWPKGGGRYARHSARARNRRKDHSICTLGSGSLLQIEQLLKEMLLLAERKSWLLFGQQGNEFTHEGAALCRGLLVHDRYSISPSL